MYQYIVPFGTGAKGFSVREAWKRSWSTPTATASVIGTIEARLPNGADGVSEGVKEERRRVACWITPSALVPTKGHHRLKEREKKKNISASGREVIVIVQKVSSLKVTSWEVGNVQTGIGSLRLCLQQ